MTPTGPVRIAGLLLAAAAGGGLALLALHPAEGGTAFADILRNEAANRAQNALVHGGFAVLLIIEVMALAVLCLQTRKAPSIAGTVLFAFGAVAMCASLVTDGLVMPAIAAKYSGLPASIEFAKSLFTLCWALIGVLMPAGLTLLGAGVVLWGIGLAHDRPTRVNGIIGIVSGIAASISIGVLGLQPLTIMGAIVGLNSWLLFLGLTAAFGKL
jgi:hypothetical protein